LWLLADAPGELLALLPRELAPTIEAHLRRYVLRAKVTISDESAQHRIWGLSAPQGAGALSGRRIGYARGQRRALLLQRLDEPPPSSATLSREHWRALDIAAGLPQVYGATSGQFVAQMLNLDCVEAISFSKGCYTGQEVIARAHYRGRIKRRMQRFVSGAPLRLAAGDAGRLEDGRSFRVVEATALSDGRCEFLAVAALPGAAPGAEDGAQAAPSPGIAASALPLPYALPD